MNRLILLAIVTACSGGIEAPRQPADRSVRSDLGMLMRTRMNPPFSKLSFLLFHAEVDAETEPLELASTADDLAYAATRLAGWATPPGGSEASKLVFYDYAESLKADSATLQHAVRANQRDTAIKTFEVLRKKCDSCHHFFRFDEAGSLETDTAGEPR
jgi:cytochrome c556